MTRTAAFLLARQRVKETGKPWLVVRLRGYPPSDAYQAHSSYAALGTSRKTVAWISVNGSERTYDGQEAPAEATEETR